MRVLLDECVNPRLKQALKAHEVTTVAEADWLTLPDSELLARAQEKVEVLVTLDRGFAYQQNLAKFSVAVVILGVKRNTMTYYSPLLDRINQAIETATPGTVVYVQLPGFD